MSITPGGARCRKKIKSNDLQPIMKYESRRKSDASGRGAGGATDEWWVSEEMQKTTLTGSEAMVSRRWRRYSRRDHRRFPGVQRPAAVHRGVVYDFHGGLVDVQRMDDLQLGPG